MGGTTYFYTQDEMASTNQGNTGGGVVLPNFTMYPGILPHMAHMKPKPNMPGFFMPDEIKLEILSRHAMSLAQIDPEQSPGKNRSWCPISIVCIKFFHHLLNF